jgi:hypothetical protein
LPDEIGKFVVVGHRRNRLAKIQWLRHAFLSQQSKLALVLTAGAASFRLRSAAGRSVPAAFHETLRSAFTPLWCISPQPPHPGNKKPATFELGLRQRLGRYAGDNKT